MSSSPILLHTEKEQVLKHGTIIGEFAYHTATPIVIIYSTEISLELVTSVSVKDLFIRDFNNRSL